MSILQSKTAIKISASRFLHILFFSLLSAEIFIVLGDIFLYQLEWLPWRSMRIPFNITREDTLVNWFSSMQTFVTALVLLVIFLLARRKRQKHAWGWAVLTGFFACMSIDDGSKFHERIGSSFREGADALSLTSRLADTFPSYYWQLVLGPLLVAITAFMVVFLWKNIKTRANFWWFMIAIAILAFAVLLDYVEGADQGIFAVHTVKHNAKLLEEFFEMLGNTIFLIVFLRVMIDRNKNITLHFKK